MAPKLPSPIQNSHSASSSSDEEMQQEEAAGQKPNAQVEDTDSDSSDDSPPPPSKATISKTVTVIWKPESSTAAKIDNSKSATLVKAGDKRKAEKKAGSKDVKKRMISESKKSEAKVTESKKSEVKVTESEDSKTQGQRVFAEESEVELLKAMTEFVSENGEDFMSDQVGYYDYVKEKFDVEFSKSQSQLMTKVKNSKKKYRKNDVVRNGEVLKPQEQKVYELCKKVWGGEGQNGACVRGSNAAANLNGKQKSINKEHVVGVEKKVNVANSDVDESESSVASLLCLAGIMKTKMLYYDHRRVLGLIEKSKRVEMVNQWENLLKEEAKLNLRRLELEREQNQLVLDALN